MGTNELGKNDRGKNDMRKNDLGKKDMTISYATFEVSSSCNMDCNFCFSYWREQDHGYEIGTKDAKKSIKYLKDRGLEAINFTGGEPLMRKDVPELILYAKRLSLTTILTTNGILLERRLPEIADNLDYIGLPLDSSDEKMHNFMRQTKAVPSHYALVRHLIDTLPKAYPQIGLKINTVVSKKNYDTIEGIGNMIAGKAITWKLSHFIPEGYGQSHGQDFIISDEIYQQTVSRCKKSNPQMNIVTTETHHGSDYCRIVSFNGHLLKPEQNNMIDLGNVVDIETSQLNQGFDGATNAKLFHDTYLRRQK